MRARTLLPIPLMLALAGCEALPEPLGLDLAPPASRPDEAADEPAADEPAADEPAPVGAGGRTPLVRKPPPDARIEYERNTIDVFRAAAPATVFVTQKRLVRDVWSRRALEVPSGSGSGFLWDTRGHVVTNYHVIADARSLTVTMYDGTVYPAVVVGGDRNKDIAVLRIDAPAKELTAIRLPPEGEPVEVGQKALAIGNPFGLDHTLTVGVISAIGREVVGYGGVTIRDMLQTDASINQGNSGGPLLDSEGRLIGMNTMILSKSGGSHGVGFAVPVSTVRRIVPQIVRHGHAQRAGLGVELIADEIARANGVVGVVIESVLRGSPAARAGLRGLRRGRRGVLLGDVIVGIDDHEVRDYDDLYTALDAHQPGDEVEVAVRRDDRTVRVKLELMAIQ